MSAVFLAEGCNNLYAWDSLFTNKSVHFAGSLKILRGGGWRKMDWGGGELPLENSFNFVPFILPVDDFATFLFYFLSLVFSIFFFFGGILK